MNTPAHTTCFLLSILLIVISTHSKPHDKKDGLRERLEDRIKSLLIRHLEEKDVEIPGDSENSNEAVHHTSNLTFILRSPVPGGSMEVRTLHLLLPVLPGAPPPPRSVLLCAGLPSRCLPAILTSRIPSSRHTLTYTSHRPLRLPATITALRAPPGGEPAAALEAVTRGGRVRGEAVGGRRRRRSESPSLEWNSETCRLHQWVVDSKEVHSAIVQPTRLTLNYCAGECRDEAPMSNNSRARLRRLEQNPTAAVPAPTCVPVAFYDRNITINVRGQLTVIVTNMFTATACSCQ